MLDIVTVILTLYTGPQCSLCDLAIKLVEEHNAQGLPEITLNKVNIRDSHDLFHLYGARIPVLKRSDSQAELAWPFELDNLVQFVK
jgi:hypothetical protein